MRAAVLALFVAFTAAAQTPQQLYQTAKAAYDKKDFPTYLAAMETLVRLRPQHPLIRANYAGALALNGRDRDKVLSDLLELLAARELAAAEAGND